MKLIATLLVLMALLGCSREHQYHAYLQQESYAPIGLVCPDGEPTDSLSNCLDPTWPSYEPIDHYPACYIYTGGMGEICLNSI